MVDVAWGCDGFHKTGQFLNVIAYQSNEENTNESPQGKKKKQLKSGDVSFNFHGQQVT